MLGVLGVELDSRGRIFDLTAVILAFGCPSVLLLGVGRIAAGEPTLEGVLSPFETVLMILGLRTSEFGVAELVTLAFGRNGGLGDAVGWLLRGEAERIGVANLELVDSSLLPL